MVSGTEAFRLPVDLSTVGIYRATVRETHPEASYRDLAFRTDPRFHSSGDLSKAIEEGRAVLRVTGQGGKELLSVPLDGVSRGPGGEYVINGDRLLTRGVGRYTVEVDVTKGAAELAGRTQDVVGIYEYWSEDLMPAGFVVMGGAGCWLAAGVGVVGAWMDKRGRGRGRAVRTSTV
jgi:hypothetical protein